MACEAPTARWHERPRVSGVSGTSTCAGGLGGGVANGIDELTTLALALLLRVRCRLAGVEVRLACAFSSSSIEPSLSSIEPSLSSSSLYTI